MAAERRETLEKRGKLSPRERDRALAAWAENKHRVVGVRDLLRLGFSRQQIERRAADGRLVRRHRGVYAIGPGPLTNGGEWLAAVMFAGPDAVLSGSAAAAHERLLAEWNGGVIDVTCPRRIAAPPPLRCHRRSLPPAERTILRGIPVTATGRTILDCAAAGAGPRLLERMLNEAFMHGIPIRPPLAHLVAAHPAHRGVTSVRRALDRFCPGCTLTKSELEERFLAFADRHGLPRPRTNFPIDTRLGPVRVDCAWPALRYALELDAPTTHGSRPAMLNDRRRDRALRSIGWRVDRLMEEDLADEEALLAELSGLLAA